MYQPIFPLIEAGQDGKYRTIKDATKSLKQDLLFLLYTSPGEWPGHPNMGIGLKHALFENSTSLKWEELKSRIYDQVARYLPVITINEVKIINDPEDIDNNYTKVIINYSIDSLGVLNIVLEAIGTSRTTTDIFS